MKFTQPVSMQCSQEQFERDLKEPLEKLGYDLREVDFPNEEGTLIATNYSNHKGVSNISSSNKEVNGRHFIDHYNPQLFLSLASMSDEPNGIEKECKEQESTIENMLGNLNNLSNIGKELFGGADKDQKARVYYSPQIDELMNEGKVESQTTYSMKDGRISNVTQYLDNNEKIVFVHPSEYQKMISTYESRIKELEEKAGQFEYLQKNQREMLYAIRQILNPL